MRTTWACSALGGPRGRHPAPSDQLRLRRARRCLRPHLVRVGPPCILRTVRLSLSGRARLSRPHLLIRSATARSGKRPRIPLADPAAGSRVFTAIRHTAGNTQQNTQNLNKSKKKAATWEFYGLSGTIVKMIVYFYSTIKNSVVLGAGEKHQGSFPPRLFLHRLTN